MTRVTFNGTVEALRGKIGDLIFRKLPDGTTVVSQGHPKKKNNREKKRANEKRSPRQKEHNSRFQDAAFYARWAAKTEPAYAELAAVSPMMTAYNFAISDWFHAPQIGCIALLQGARSARQIVVDASDDVLVAKVRVTVLDEESRIIETGEAVQDEEGWWVFASRAEGKTVVAEARDLPGNVTKLELEL